MRIRNSFFSCVEGVFELLVGDDEVFQRELLDFLIIIRCPKSLYDFRFVRFEEFLFFFLHRSPYAENCENRSDSDDEQDKELKAGDNGARDSKAARPF